LCPSLYRKRRTDTTPVEGLDPGIAAYVHAFREAGVQTFESCQGGPGHAFAAPTIRFAGQREEGFRVLALALELGFPVRAIQRYWAVNDGEPCGPDWEIVFKESAC
jgi:hypothetical protein